MTSRPRVTCGCRRAAPATAAAATGERGYYELGGTAWGRSSTQLSDTLSRHTSQRSVSTRRRRSSSSHNDPALFAPGPARTDTGSDGGSDRWRGRTPSSLRSVATRRGSVQAQTRAARVQGWCAEALRAHAWACVFARRAGDRYTTPQRVVALFSGICVALVALSCFSDPGRGGAAALAVSAAVGTAPMAATAAILSELGQQMSAVENPSMSPSLRDTLFDLQLDEWGDALLRAGVRTTEDLARITSPDDLPADVPASMRMRL
eukprot:gene22971-6084_t